MDAALANKQDEEEALQERLVSAGDYGALVDDEDESQQHQQHQQGGSGGRVQEARVLVAVEDGTQLKTDALGGVCCPVGSAYAHTGASRLTAPLLVAFAFIVLLSAVDQMVMVTLIQDCDEQVDANGRPLPCEPDSDDTEVGDLFAAHGALQLVQFLVAIVAVAYFFLWYRRRAGERATEGGPDVVSRCLFPVATVYYHEGNQLSARCILSGLCGCFYTVPFYKPSWLERREAQLALGELVQAPAVETRAAYASPLQQV